MNEVLRRECEAPRCAGLLLTALLLVAATRGFGGESMTKVGSGITITTSDGTSISDVSCYCWPVTPSDSTPGTQEVKVNGSSLVQLPGGAQLWVGLVSDAGSASWSFAVSSFSTAWADDEWETIAAWTVDPSSGNRIAPDDDGLQACTGGSVPASLYKKLEPVDGSDADELSVKLDGAPSGSAGCRIIAFAK
jgi:hypothetical protein